MLLPDSPPRRWHGTYKGKGKSRLIAAANGDEDMVGETGGPPPIGPTDEERIEQAHALYDRERQRANHLDRRSKPYD